MRNEVIYRPRLDFEQQQPLSGCGNNFNLIANTIRAVGNFEFAGERYYPFLPKSNMISPLNVIYSNLQSVVTALATRNTPIQVRKNFYNLNYLPGAI